MSWMKRLLWIPAVVTAFVGCSADDGKHPYAPVSGRITIDGQPLAGATVTFIPISNQLDAGYPSQAVTDATGHFSLKTTHGREKAVVGEHTVSISTERIGPEGDVAQKEQIPARYNDRTELRFTVPQEGSTDANFDLQSRRPKK